MARESRNVHHQTAVSCPKPDRRVGVPPINDTNFPALAPNPRVDNKIEWCAPFEVMKLPKEIRLLIWEHLVPEHEVGRRHMSKYRDTKYILPRICRVSPLIANDIAGILVRDYELVIGEKEQEMQLHKFLSSFPRGYQSVHRLDLFYFDVWTDDRGDKFGYNGANVPREGALDVVHSLPNLTVLTLTFGARYESGMKGDPRYPPACRLQTASQIVRKYRLHQLLRCKSLSEIHLDNRWCPDPELSILENVAVWLVDNFDRRCPDQKITVTTDRAARPQWVGFPSWYTQ